MHQDGYKRDFAVQTGLENCLRLDIINCIAKTNLLNRSMWRVMCKSVGCPSMNCVLPITPVSTCPTAFVSFYPSFRAITNIHWQQSRHQAPHCSKENFSPLRYSQYKKIVVIKYLWSQIFSRSRMLVCLSSVAAAYRSTMEHFPRTSLSSFSISLPF